MVWSPGAMSWAVTESRSVSAQFEGEALKLFSFVLKSGKRVLHHHQRATKMQTKTLVVRTCGNFTSVPHSVVPHLPIMNSSQSYLILLRESGKFRYLCPTCSAKCFIRPSLPQDAGCNPKAGCSFRSSFKPLRRNCIIASGSWKWKQLFP